MPFDYSQPEWRTLFANYGRTAHTAQLLEKTLLILLGAVVCRKQDKQFDSALRDFLTQNRRKRVRAVINALKEEMPTFPPGLDTDLLKAFDARDKVIHHFFFDSFEGESWARPPEQMDRELRPICERLRSLQNRVDALLEYV
jgi:hypothetical protein